MDDLQDLMTGLQDDQSRNSTAQPTQPAQPAQPAQPQTYEQALAEAVVALGRHSEMFHRGQSQLHDAISQVVDRLSNLETSRSTSSRPTGSARYHDPRMFDGKADNVIPWVKEIRTAIHLSRAQLPNDYDQVMFASTFLKDGNPTSWFNSVEISNPKVLHDFQGFIRAFKNHFEDPDLVAKYLRKLKAHTQTGSVANYAARFREFLVHVDLNDATQIDYFYEGLKDHIKDVLATVLELPKTLDAYIALATKIDNKAHARELERKLAKSSSNSRHIPHHHEARRATPPPAPSSTAPAQSSTNNDVVPMEVDAICHGPLTDAEKERRRKLGLCFYCGQGKHRVSECPNMSDSAKKNRKASPSSGKA